MVAIISASDSVTLGFPFRGSGLPGRPDPAKRASDMADSSTSNVEISELRLRGVVSALDEVLVACKQDLKYTEEKITPERQPGRVTTWNAASIASVYLGEVGLTEDAKLLEAEAKKFSRILSDLFLCLLSTGKNSDEVAALQEQFGPFPAMPDDPAEADRLRNDLRRRCRKLGDTLCRHMRRTQGLLTKESRGDESGGTKQETEELSPYEQKVAKRNEWFYNERIAGKTWNAIFMSQGDECKGCKIGSTDGVRRGAKKHAAENDKSLPKGKGGRPKQSN